MPIGKRRHIRKGVAMRTHGEPNFRNIHKALIAGPPYARRTQNREPRNPGVADPDEVRRTRLAGLIQEHRDLDGAISLLFADPICDELLIARLKKRKLQLKDEIMRVAD